MHRTKILLLQICLLSQLNCAHQKAGPEIPEPVVKKIDSLFKDFNSLNSPGYAIGISKNGNTLYQNGYGSANLDYNIPIGPGSAFSIASVSKQFTAACIAPPDPGK